MTLLPTPQLDFIEYTRPCSYLEKEQASLRYRKFDALTASELEILISRGWRRFGNYLFRPACRVCEKCVPIRINVESFSPTKSQRRAWKKNDHIRCELADVSLTPKHLSLYNSWHEAMTTEKDWEAQVIDSTDYFSTFLRGNFESARELRYFDGDRLVGIGLIDLMPHSISSIYFYHDPDWRMNSPGTYSLQCEIELARKLGLKWVYLGFWISQCPSMAYKARFEPFQILKDRPDDDHETNWLNGVSEEPILPVV